MRKCLVAHNDVKPGNICKSQAPHSLPYKLIDLDAAIQLKEMTDKKPGLHFFHQKLGAIFIPGSPMTALQSGRLLQRWGSTIGKLCWGWRMLWSWQGSWYPSTASSVQLKTELGSKIRPAWIGFFSRPLLTIHFAFWKCSCHTWRRSWRPEKGHVCIVEAFSLLVGQEMLLKSPMRFWYRILQAKLRTTADPLHELLG